MLVTNTKTRPLNRNSQRGMTLVETMIALAVLFVMAGGMLGIGAVAMLTAENQGHLAARTAEYAQDKLEQLMSIPFANTDMDTFTVTPTVNCVQFLVNSACTTPNSGLTVTGTSDPACSEPGHGACVNNFVDYLDIGGKPLGGGVTAPASWYYRRVWLVEDISPFGVGTLKRITVSAKTRYLIGQWRSGKEPRATVVTLKSAPF